MLPAKVIFSNTTLPVMGLAKGHSYPGIMVLLLTILSLLSPLVSSSGPPYEPAFSHPVESTEKSRPGYCSEANKSKNDPSGAVTNCHCYGGHTGSGGLKRLDIIKQGCQKIAQYTYGHDVYAGKVFSFVQGAARDGRLQPGLQRDRGV